MPYHFALDPRWTVFYLQALNVVLRMAPIMSGYSYNSRSFFTNKGAQDIGGGFQLWRGYFQSVRPALGKMLVNIDISTGLMYKPGSLISLCLNFLGLPSNDPRALSRMNEYQHRRLREFLAGIRVKMAHSGRTETVKKLTKDSAREHTFKMRDGQTMTVEKYFKVHCNKTLRFPDLICVQVCLFIHFLHSCVN
jgi:eukaryotic translation initiation factor 2C